jgi:HEAT repeat protein
MTEELNKLCETIHHGTRETIWDSAKRLESVVNEVVAQLLRVLLEGERIESRTAAAYVLGFCRFALARHPLEETLQDTKQDSILRGHAAEAVGCIGDPRSIPVLLECLSKGDSGIKYWCLFALGELGTSEVLPALRGIADGLEDCSYEGHSVRSEARDAISKIETRTSKTRSRL